MDSISQKNFFALLAFGVIAVLTVIHPVHAQKVDTDPANVTVLEGATAKILCRFSQPILYCRMEIPGEKTLVLSEGWSKDGFSYNGEGLTQGQCGVTIERVKNSNDGPVRCFMGVSGEEQVGVVHLTVALLPIAPEIEVLGPNHRNNEFEIDEQVTAKCISRDGRPAAALTWFLEDEPLTDNLGLVEIGESLASNNQTLYTTSQTITRYIRATDDRKRLICRAVHIAHPQPQETHLQLQVRYRPQPQPEVRVFGVVQGLTALVNVTVQANPRPRTEWIISGQTIQQGQQSGRYEAFEPVDLGSGSFNVTLSIAGLTLEDTTLEYVLKASNAFGAQEYTVRISSSEAVAVTGLDVGAIVGIVVGAALLVVIIAIIVVARLTGKWCFSGKKSSSNIPHPSETSDTESADVKAAKSQKKFSLSFPGMFKKSKASAGDEEQANASADDVNDDAARSEATVIMEDDPPKAGEKNLVYAELMLKPSADNSSPDKNSTEYAEIVYVSPPAGQAPQDGAKKA